MTKSQFKLANNLQTAHIQYLKTQKQSIELSLIKNKFPKNILDQFFTFSEIKFKKLFKTENEKLKKKFNNLVKTQSVELVDENYIDNCFTNLTNVEIPKEVKEIVSLGPNFCTNSLPSKQDVSETIKNVESALNVLKIEHTQKHSIRHKIVNHIWGVRNSATHLSKIDRSVREKINVTKEFLKEKNKIFFTMSDKGNRSVCIEKDVYKQKIGALLNDTSTYVQVKKNPLQKLQKETAKILQDLYNNEFLDEKYHERALTLTDTMLAKGYGLVKLLKENHSVRHFISLINSPTHKLASLLYNDLKKAIPKPRSHINNSRDFVSKIKGAKLNNSDMFTSLHVSSLFTNFTCELVIKSLEKRARLIQRKCKIPFDEIIRCTRFLFDNTFFVFNEKFYQQINGCPMGSPISALFADIVIEDLEIECLNKLKKEHKCKITHYYRYVDDTFLIIDKQYLDSALMVFNNYDKNLSFTDELEKDGCLNFLDVTVHKDKNEISTNWYRKEIASERILHFYSAHPIHHKKNIVYNLTDRAFLLSDKKFHKNNRKIITDLLLKNKYPLDFINKQIKTRLRKISHSESSQSTRSKDNDLNSIGYI